MTHTKQMEVDCDDEVIRTFSTSDPYSVKKWINWLYSYRRSYENRAGVRANSGLFILGLDVEWKPNTSPQVPEILQLCRGNHCIVIHMRPISRYLKWCGLKDLLESDRWIFCGVGIKGDVTRLERHYDIEFNHDRLYPLDRKARDLGLSCGGNYSLASLAQNVANLDFYKDHDIARSDWSKNILSNEQIEYAARDAFVSFRIGHEIIVNLQDGKT